MPFRSKKLSVTEVDVAQKVLYLGNVATGISRSDQCTDGPVAAIWANHMQTQTSTAMQLTVCAWGLAAQTKQHGVTEYRAHRISYFTTHPAHPRLFVWVYRHEGKKMKVEPRCHVVMCKTPEVAKELCSQLHDKLSLAFAEFLRDKVRRQKSRLVLQKLSQHGSLDAPQSASTTRSKFLTTGQNFKPSVERSRGAPKLLAISEDREGERLEQLDEEEEESVANTRLSSTPSSQYSDDDEKHHTAPYSVAMGNDIVTDVTVQQVLLELDQRAQQGSIIDSCSLNSENDEALSIESGFFSDDVTNCISSGASSVTSGSDVGGDVTRCHSPAPSSCDVIVDMSPVMTSRL